MRCTNNRTTSEIKRGITPFNYMQGGLMPILGNLTTRVCKFKKFEFYRGGPGPPYRFAHGIHIQHFRFAHGFHIQH